MRTGSVVVLGLAMNTLIVSSSKLVMNASSQPLTMPGRISGSVMRRNTVKRRGAERHRGALDRRVHAGGRGQHQPQREGQDHDHVRHRQAAEGAVDVRPR